MREIREFSHVKFCEGFVAFSLFIFKMFFKLGLLELLLYSDSTSHGYFKWRFIQI